MPVWKITIFSVKHVGLAIPDPILTSHGNWNESSVVIGNHVADLHSRVEFRSIDHLQLIIMAVRRYGAGCLITRGIPIGNIVVSKIMSNYSIFC